MSCIVWLFKVYTALLVVPVPLPPTKATLVGANSNSKYIDDAPIRPRGIAFEHNDPKTAEGIVKQKSYKI